MIEWWYADDESIKHSITKEIFGEEYSFNFTNCRYRIKKKRWRAKIGDDYFFISSTISTSSNVMTAVEDYDRFDNDRYKFGNYFRTEEQAKKARELLKETLIKFNEENE